MSIFMSDGSFRQRAKCSEEATEAARETRRLKVALQTYETLRQFEEALQRREEAMSRAYDDIPAEALPVRWTHHGSNQVVFRRSFIEVRDEPATNSVLRTRSQPPPDKSTLESALEAFGSDMRRSQHASSLLDRMEKSFREPSAPYPPYMEPTGARLNAGSWSHPECCARPCIRFMHGTCANGDDCKYCHLPHEEALVKLDKRQRRAWDSLSAQQQLTLIVPVLHLRAAVKELGAFLEPVLTLLEKELSGFEEPATIARFKHGLLQRALTRMKAARLVELIAYSEHFDTSFTEKLLTVFTRLRMEQGP